MQEVDDGREAGSHRRAKRQRREFPEVADDDGTSASLQSRDGRQDIGAALHAGSPPGVPAAPAQSHSTASTASRDAGQQEVRRNLPMVELDSCCCSLHGKIVPHRSGLQATEAESDSQGAGPCNWKLVNATLKGEKFVKYRALLPLGPGEGHYRIGDFPSKEVRAPGDWGLWQYSALLHAVVGQTGVFFTNHLARKDTA